MTDYGTPDLYRSPRFSSELAEAMKGFTTSTMWDDWDLNGLLVDVPMAKGKNSRVDTIYTMLLNR